MDQLLSLPADQFRAALAELQLGPEREADLVRQYRQANSPFASLLGMIDGIGAQDADAGMQRAAMLPVSRPEGMSVFDAVRSGEAQFAVPQGLIDMAGGVARGIDAPAAAAQGLIPVEDMIGEAMGTAGFAMGAGGLLARPDGSVGMGGRVIDFEELRRQRARDRLIGVLQRAVDDIQSGNYQRRIDETAFAAHQEGLLPLQVGTRVVPPQSYDMPGSWQISGYFVDPNNPRRFGYKLESNAGDTYDAIVSDSQLGLNLNDPTRFGGGFRAFAGPRGEALQYQNLPQAPQGAIDRDIDLSERAQIDEEYRQLFGDDLSANRSTTTGLLAAAASDTPAQRVARLLREGRADEVTDDLMAQADPQEMFRLYEAGETGMDLPLDEASRMVRAAGQGYDISRPMYHGTDTDFASIDTNMGAGERYRTGFFTSDNPDVAASYAPNRDLGRILPVFSRASDQGVVVDAQGANWNRIGASSPARMRNSALENEFPELSDAGNAYSFFPRMYDDLMGLRELSTNAMARERRFEGDPSITFENVIDRGPYSLTNDQALSASQPSRVAVDFYPQNIRSRFARFDPRLRHLANLNAANVDPLTGLLAIMQAQEPRQ
jgi:hypothetical protein